MTKDQKELLKGMLIFVACIIAGMVVASFMLWWFLKLVKHLQQ
jgi:hypothetical protein